MIIFILFLYSFHFVGLRIQYKHPSGYRMHEEQEQSTKITFNKEFSSSNKS